MTRVTRAVVGVFLLWGWALAAQAEGEKPAQPANPFGLSKHDANAPIAVSADSFTGDLQTKVGTYSGNVLISQGEMKLRADRVKVNVTEGKPNKIEAIGGVVFNAPSGTATGDNGVYDLGPRTITLSGHVVLTKDKNVMRGTTLVVNLTTGEAKLGAQGMPGGRVQGLFQPPPSTDQKTRPKAAPKTPANSGPKAAPAGTKAQK